MKPTLFRKARSDFSGLGQFLVLWSGQTLSTLGSSMSSFALVLWTYGQTGSALNMSMLSVCTYFPSVFFTMFAGALADRWDKKRMMLACDFIAAMGTGTVWALFALGRLEVWHLYVVNFLIGCMNAFQNPAANVAISLITPAHQYTRIGGLHALSNALNTLLTPALATALYATVGLSAVFLMDILAFAYAFLSLLLFIRIPRAVTGGEKFSVKKCLDGVAFLRTRPSLLKLILFFAFINLIASMSGNGLLSAMILRRTGGNEAVVGMVSTGLGIGSLIGSLVATALRPPRDRPKMIFLATGLSFLMANVVWGVTSNPVIWLIAAITGFFWLPFINTHLSALMRIQVPLEMHGRVFAARDTLQWATIPVGMLLGGALADHVFEPFMAGESALAALLGTLVGAGSGSGIALMMLLSGVIGTIACFVQWRNPRYRDLID